MSCKQLTEVVLGEGIKTIPESCFESAGALASITLPVSLTTVSDYAFCDCSGLKEVHYAGTQEQWDTVKVGEENDALTSLMNKGITLSETELTLVVGKTATLTATGKDVTWKSANEAVATVENGVVKAIAMGKTTITAAAGDETASCIVTVNGTWGSQIQWYFDEETGLLRVSGSGDMPDCVSLGSDAPWYQYKDSIVKLEVESGITGIGNCIFRAYSQLEEVTLPDSVTKIGASTFDGVSKLTSVNLDKVEQIGNEAFVNCTGLTSVSLESAKTIGTRAFAGCSGLTSATLGSEANCVESVGKQAFSKCGALGTVNFKNVKAIGQEAFKQSGLTSADLTTVETIGNDAFNGDTALTKVTFGSQTSAIGESAFTKTGLTSVEIPGSATLGMCAFMSCEQLTEAVLGEGIKTIPESCFERAGTLTSITLPVSLTTVGAYAFCDCSGLKEIHYAGTQEQWDTVKVGEENDALTALMNKDKVAVTGISLDKAELELKLKGESEQLVATITPTDATNTAVAWTSSNEKVATVDALGKVTPVEVGETVITVTANDGGFQASCNVKVVQESGDLDDVDLSKFQFTLYSSKMANSVFVDSTLTAKKQSDGSYALHAPSYAVEYTTGTVSITVQAPEGFQTPFSVTYTRWNGSNSQEETIQSENGTVEITGYYNKWGKNVSGLVDMAPGLLYSDFAFSFEGSSNTVPVHFELYNSLKTIIVENQANSERNDKITKTDTSTYEVHLIRGESYQIIAQGGFTQVFAESNCSISDGTNTEQGVRESKMSYTPGAEKNKDFEIRVTSRESSYNIAEGVYKLHVIVDDAPENVPVFEKFVYTLNGVEHELKYDASTEHYAIPQITQFDKLSIKAVVNNVDAGSVYHWKRWDVPLEETGATIEVDTTSSNKHSYTFDCSIILPGGYEVRLPNIYVALLNVTNIPAPTILTQPVDVEAPVGSQVSLSVLVAYPENGIPQFQWYRCDDEKGTNAEAIKDATNSTRRLDGYESIYLAPSDEIGTKWYYCEINSYNFEISSSKIKTNCIKVEIVKNKLPLDGEGTSGKPYLITSADDLIAIREAVADGNAFVGQYFEFEKDVTLPDDWQPIGCTKDGSNLIDKGNNLNAFSGIIDGAGHTLTIPAGGLPLLGYVWNASVSNLNIYGSQIDGYGLVNNYHGVGMDGTAIVIDNVTLKTGTQTLKAGLIGSEMNSENGFAGASASCTVTIRNCTVEDGVVIGYGKDQSMIGAIAGRLHGVIENCKSSATVYGVDYVGGILGCRDNALGLCSVNGCSFDGSVVASGDHAGGIVGGGYTNQTAPNGIKVTANNNTVTGSITGHDKVGGILGGDSYVAQAWNAYTFKVNHFAGTVRATGGSYVGGIIGYYKSLNIYDDVLGNTYSGADKGIGFVLYVDTSCETATGMDGTVIINTAKGVSGLPVVAGCDWQKELNRTDDPLGKDIEKLFKKLDGGEDVKPTCYEIRVSGTYKTEYTAGEELDLSGIQLTAVWTDGTTTKLKLSDVEISGYDKDKAGKQTVFLSYGIAKVDITVTVIPKSSKITVSVTIKGDSKHGANGSVHGLAIGGLTTWASESGVEADTSETVWDVLQRVGAKKGISFNADSNNSYGTVYIRAVNGLGEFDNGPKSGWMYTVNGTHPEVGVAAKYLKNGDNIVLHYTDDYDYEEGGNKYGQKPSGGTTTGGSTGGTTTGGTTGTTTGGTSMITTADRNKAAAVDKLIEKVGNVTKDSGPAIEAARKAYNDLTPTQKRLVTKLKELTDAEKAYAKLTATAEDQQKAKDVMDKISKIGNVTKDSEQDIKDARKAYDALTDLQKLLVDNYEALTAAETKFAMLDTLGKVSDPYINTGDYMEKLGTPNVGAIGGEWMVIGLARSGRTVPGVEDYYQKAVEYVQSSIDPDTGRLHKAKSTDNSRMILALTAIGKDVTNVGGYNLLQGLSDFEYVKYQGNNGPIWALLALDSGNYPVPSGGTTTRQALIDEILSVQTSDGGWAISGDKADSDMTGMALTALAPYYKKDPTVKQAIDKAIARLSEMQDDDGGFSTTYGDGKYIATSESTAQVLTALSALGIDGDTDSRFVKNGSSVVDALLRYYVKGGGFKHIMDGEIDGMGTEQAYYALTAYYRFLSGKTNLYDMTDIIDMGGDVVTVEPTVPAATEPTEAAQTNIPWWIIAVCIFGGAGWGVVIGIVLVPKLNKKKD